MKTLLLVLIFSAAALLAECDPALLQQIAPPDAGTAPIDTALIERGVQVYRSQYCGTCHQLDIANTRGNFGPAHNDAGLVALERIQQDTYRGSATTAGDYIRESILEPQIYYATGYEATSHHMPSYAHLAPEDIEAMVYMLVNQQ